MGNVFSDDTRSFDQFWYALGVGSPSTLHRAAYDAGQQDPIKPNLDEAFTAWSPETMALSPKWQRTLDSPELSEATEVAAAYRQMRNEGSTAEEPTGLYSWYVTTPDESRYAEGTRPTLQDAMDDADRVLRLWVDDMGIG